MSALTQSLDKQFSEAPKKKFSFKNSNYKRRKFNLKISLLLLSKLSKNLKNEFGNSLNCFFLSCHENIFSSFDKTFVFERKNEVKLSFDLTKLSFGIFLTPKSFLISITRMQVKNCLSPLWVKIFFFCSHNLQLLHNFKINFPHQSCCEIQIYIFYSFKFELIQQWQACFIIDRKITLELN